MAGNTKQVEHRVKTTIGQGGLLTLERLPFEVGSTVDVTIVSNKNPIPTSDPFPLRGLPIRYDNSFDPIDVDEWTALE